MDILTIAIILSAVWVALFALSFFFKALKLVLKAFFFVNIILFAAGGVLGYFVYVDIMDLKQNFPTQEKLILLEHNEQYLAGMEIREISIDKDSDESDLPITVIEPETLEQYKGKMPEEIIGDNYKVIVINSEFFTDEIQFEDSAKFKTEDLIDVISADNSPQKFAELLVNTEITADISDELGIEQEDAKFDNTLLLFMAMGIVQNNGPRHLIRELSEKNLEIYPETITFKLIDYLPDTILEKSIGKLD